ncbi:site-specific DNA-methyltransferase [Mycoplasma sp. 888]|uniref:DNA-methyltransferase n=1 Tax=Mycoplasma sp. 888 TaxID=3108483 RepID=UPI002D766DF2|nr:site-specific DNA-methyltransferase [Mycoplasma sp. 888]WRQ25712.1 site-specific DNA-methyltransferase [Mycoplasma sp. 888]
MKNNFEIKATKVRNVKKRDKFDKTNFTSIKKKISKNVLELLKKKKIIKDYFYDEDFCLINGECIETMNALIENNILIDHIITDIPYGTVQGLSIEGWRKKQNVPNWDVVINKDKMFDCCFKISKPNSNLLLFTQEPLTWKLISSMNDYEKYSLSNKMIWVKNNHANGFNSKTTPLNYYEEILLIRKSLDENNSIDLRKYFKSLLEFIPDTKKEIMNKLGQGLDHCFRYENRTFYLPTETNYNKLIETYNIDKFSNFIEYDEMKRMWDDENRTVFNKQKNSKIIKNVLEYNKDKNNIHPTQKPLDLLKYLIDVFTDKNDWVLDFTSGSGSTGIAAISKGRKFIGIELDEEFYKKSIQWYKEKTTKKIVEDEKAHNYIYI